jgi:uncharacterized membrane protein YczE
MLIALTAAAASLAFAGAASAGTAPTVRYIVVLKLKSGLSHGTWRAIVSAKGRTSTTLKIKLK